MDEIKKILDAYYRGVYSENETLHRIAHVLYAGDARHAQWQRAVKNWRNDPATPEFNAMAARLAAHVGKPN